MINAALILTSLLPNVSYETKAARLPVILAELETRIGSKLECEPSFKNDVLIIRVERVGSMELLDKIAQATVGKWTRREDRLVLSPDVDRRKVQEEELLARREKDIQRMLDQFKKDVDRSYDTPNLHTLKAALDDRKTTFNQNEWAARISQQRSLAPLDRLAMRTLLELGARRLAEIKPGQRLVFSGNPTPRQFKWPNQNELLKNFYTEWNLYQELFSGSDRVLHWTNVRDTGVVPTQLSSVDRIWLSVADPLFETRNTQVTVMNSAETVGFGSTLEAAMPSIDSQVRSPDEISETPMQLEPMSVALSEAWKTLMSSTRPRVSVDPKLLEFISRPSKNEPLVIGSELYHQYARARKVNLVAWINDNAFGRGVVFKAETVKMFDQFSRPNMNFDEANGWLVMTPSSPVEARRSRDDREAMERLMQSVISQKRITFEAKADYVSRRAINLAEGLGLRLSLLIDQSHPTLRLLSDEPVLRLYGSLSREQRKNLLAGGRIPYQSLSSAQRALWDQLIYGSRPINHQAGFRLSPRAARSRLAMSIEPTFEWPNGIPSGASLGLEVKSDFELKPQPKNNMHFTGPYDLAQDLFYEQNPDCIEGDISQWRRPDTFVVFEKANYTFNIALDDNFSYIDQFEDFKDLTGPVKFDQFPENIRKAILSQVDDMKRRKAEGVKFKLTLGGRQGVKPPPPP